MHRQQEEMYQYKKHTVKDPIVNIFQPHIRPIVRGKAGKQTEFGAKISASIVDGFATMDRILFDSYNEGEDIENQVELYNKLYGAYPKRVLADQIYQTRKNRAYCKTMGIKLSGKPLGRPPKAGFTNEQKETWRLDECERIPIEGKFGQLKRRFSLDRIMAKFAVTSKVVLRTAFIVVNLERILYLPKLRIRDFHFLFNIYQIINTKRIKWVFI
jgi:transposase, IS5 family